MGLAHDTVQWQTVVGNIYESSEYSKTGNYLTGRVSYCDERRYGTAELAVTCN